MDYKITDNKKEMDVDAIHDLYEQFGFTPLTEQTMFMQLWTPDVYSQT